MRHVNSEPASDQDTLKNGLPPFSEFISALKAKMKLVFHERGDINQLSSKRGLPPFVLR